MLNLRVPYISGESATSFCSRLALRNRCSSMLEFSQDVGLPFKDIQVGRPETITRLAELGGVEPSLLLTSALRADGTRFICGSNQIDLAARRHMHQLFACPACLSEDRASAPEAGDAAPAGRTAWMLKAIMTCQKHGLVLAPLPLPASSKSSQQYDFARQVQSLALKPGDHTPRPASSLERYLYARLDGKPSPLHPQIDSMPFYAVAHASYVIGAFCLHGPKVRLRKLSEQQCWECSAIGFDLLAAGPKALQATLLENMTRWPKAKNAGSAVAYFGSLHSWLDYHQSDPAYEFLRKMVRELVVSNRPLRANTLIYGVGPGANRLSSVHTASEEIKMHPKRLKRLLIAAGILDQEAARHSAHQAAFPADAKAAEVLQRVKRCIPKWAAATYINAPPLQFDLLHKAGLIEAFINSGDEIKDYGFDTRDLDAFLERLMAGIQDDIPKGLQLLQIQPAAKRARCSALTIVQLILEHKLTRLYRQPDTEGFMSILVDLEEVRSVLDWPTRPGLSIAEVEKRMLWSRPVITALIEHGLLPARTINNPLTNMLQTIIELADLQAFDNEFVALSALARKQRQLGATINAKLLKLGAKPALDPKVVGATFFERKNSSGPKSLLRIADLLQILIAAMTCFGFFIQPKVES